MVLTEGNYKIVIAEHAKKQRRSNSITVFEYIGHVYDALTDREVYRTSKMLVKEIAERAARAWVRTQEPMNVTITERAGV